VQHGDHSRNLVHKDDVVLSSPPTRGKSALRALAFTPAIHDQLMILNKA